MYCKCGTVSIANMAPRSVEPGILEWLNLRKICSNGPGNPDSLRPMHGYFTR